MILKVNFELRKSSIA